MGNRAMILFLNKEEQETYKNDKENYIIKNGTSYVYTQWNGGIESVQAFLDFGRFLNLHNKAYFGELNRLKQDFLGILQNFFAQIDSRFEYSIFSESISIHSSCSIDIAEGDFKISRSMCDNKPYLIDFETLEILSYSSEEIQEARDSQRYKQIYDGLKKQYAKLETEIVEMVLDVKKLASDIGYAEQYDFFKKHKIHFGPAELESLTFATEFWNNVEYDAIYTRGIVEGICKMLDKIIKFCEDRHIKYINIL